MTGVGPVFPPHSRPRPTCAHAWCPPYPPALRASGGRGRASHPGGCWSSGSQCFGYSRGLRNTRLTLVTSLKMCSVSKANCPRDVKLVSRFIDFAPHQANQQMGLAFLMFAPMLSLWRLDDRGLERKGKETAGPAWVPQSLGCHGASQGVVPQGSPEGDISAGLVL